MRAILVLLAMLALAAGAAPGNAVELSLPGNATMTREMVERAGTYFLPIGPYEDGALPSEELEGRIVQQAWRIKAQGLTTLQMLSPLQAQLRLEGYKIVFSCIGQECGGFDFRFNTRVMAAPDMFVDLFDYRFLSAKHDNEGTGADYVSLMISRSGNTGYVQIIHAAPDDVSVVSITPQEPKSDQVESNLQQETTQPLIRALTERGHVVLVDLEFESGSSSLGAGPYASLRDIADYLNANDSRRVALVGHTDAVGELETNIALSRRRAASVLERLAVTYQVSRTQLEAGGMGYLSPVASNLTTEGREANRRVEAVLLGAE